MKLLVTGAFDYTSDQLKEISSIGHEIFYIQDEEVPLKEQNIKIDPDEIEGTICNRLFLYNDIEEFRSLRFIQLTSAGYDRVPMEYIIEHGINIQNARGVYSIPMAEYAVCGVLQLLKQSRFFYKNQSGHAWIKNRNLLELSEKTVCIVGCGSIGSECAKRFSAFNTHVIGIDLNHFERQYFQKIYPTSEIDRILSISDVIILTLPYTDQNRHLFDKEKFDSIKRGAIFVNIARGKLVDEDAFVKALEDGILSGAVLDVFDEEPLPSDSRFWNMENVIITPHNSYVSDKNNKRMFQQIINSIIKWSE